MELLERNKYLTNLDDLFKQVESGKGQAVFLMGEAGIGKTSLVNHWVETKESKASVYVGACDSLFTPRPLGPLFDVAPQINQQLAEALLNEKDRTRIFTSLIQHLAASERPVILVFEDIHWADDATLDLIKFLARRVNRLRCLFIATYRDDEISGRHPLTTLFGEIPSGHFSKIPLAKFSKEIVDVLASRKGYHSGQQLFLLTSGNPFYVMEILSGDNFEIPERVKDSILARFHSIGDETKALWELLSILPSGRIEPYIADRIEQDFGKRLDECIVAGVIISRPGYLSFKHELFRLTIEESLSPSKRKGLHKKMLEIIQNGPRGSINLSQLVHHARYADENELVADLAPKAAKEAATVGAHREAAKLYSTAIEYSRSDDVNLANLYERHAYESYLVYQLPAAINSQEHALELWRKQKMVLREGDAMRFLSRLWWFAGDQKKALAFGHQAIEVLERDIAVPSSERAHACSNLAQLAMLAEDDATTLSWGNKAIDLATQLGHKEILSHALNNVGTVQLRNSLLEQEGERKLNQSLTIALENGYHEHAARAYINLAFTFLLTKKYEKARPIFEVGIKYCEERDLDFLTYYMLGCKARMLMETGVWKEALNIGEQLQTNHHHLLVRIVVLGALARIEMRSGRFDEAREHLKEVKAFAKDTRELQRIIPIVTAELELKWLTSEPVPSAMVEEIREIEDHYFPEKNNSWYYSDFDYWKRKCGLENSDDANIQFTLPFKLERQDWKKAAEVWKKIGCPYERALCLLGGEEEHQRQGLEILDNLGAVGAGNLFRSKLKLRGPRESTLSNPGQLTDRQIDILNLLNKGLQNKEIADKLFISPKTVDHHISAILSKLEVSSRAKAVVQAQKLGILK